MDNIGILGGGRVGAHLAQALAARGHRVVIGHRDPAAAAAAWQGPAVRHASMADAAAAAPLLINATPGDLSLQLLSEIRGPLAGKVLVDLANASVRNPNGVPGGLMYPQDSLGQRLQQALPQSRVVKSLSTMAFPVMTAPRSLSAPATVFLSGDDPAAKARVRALLGELGWPAEWMLDLGGIDSAHAVEALILMAPHVVAARGVKPFALTVAV